MTLCGSSRLDRTLPPPATRRSSGRREVVGGVGEAETLRREREREMEGQMKEREKQQQHNEEKKENGVNKNKKDQMDDPTVKERLIRESMISDDQEKMINMTQNPDQVLAFSRSVYKIDSSLE